MDLLTDILTAILFLVSFAIYVWIVSAGNNKLDKQLEDDMDKYNLPLFYHRHIHTIWFLFITGVFWYLMYTLLGIDISN